jgi:PKD domain
LKLSIPTVLSAAIAALGLLGLLSLALATGAGSAPGGGQQVFDAPGCLPKAYDGPGHSGHYVLGRNCPTPRPVILRRTSRRGGGWLVRWDGSRTYDPMGGPLVSYEWTFDGTDRRHGRRASVFYRRPGPHSVVLYVTNDSGLTGTTRMSAEVP